ncbi:MAG: Smr/MutS family protein [Sphaerochaetaceae bacterium]
MPKKKKKQAVRKSETAGNSRLVVDSNAYKPFAHIKEVKSQTIIRKQPPIKDKPVSQRKEPIVLGYDPKANFGDILTSWEETGELGGVTKRMKSHSKVTVEKSFGEILADWEGEKRAAKNTKAKPVSIKKSDSYVPKKDFGALLDEFEKNEPPRKPKQSADSNQQVTTDKDHLIKPSVEMQQALKEKEELDRDRSNPVNWSFADTYHQWSKQTDVEAAIKKAQKEKREAKADPYTISSLRAMEPQATLDLHGMKIVEAEQATADFLRSTKEQRLLKVSIITGKGLHNGKGYSVLKEAVLSQIRLSGVVREAYTPKAYYGGSGAIWIILKQ